MPSRRRRRIATGALWFFAIAVAGYAVAFLASDAVGAPDFHAHFRTIFLAPALHIGAGALALVVAPFQLSSSLRARAPAVHRLLGRVYLVAVLASSAGGLVLALRSTHGVVAQSGFAGLAVAWAGTAIAGLVAIREGRVADHRGWMLRNVALTLAAVTLRIYLPLAMIGGLPMAAAYPAIAWLCWVPNLVVAGALVRRAPVPQPARSTAMRQAS